jgi:hypothetical protein
MYSQQSASERETLPLSAVAFRRYLQAYQLELLDVALKSGVRYMTVWRIGQGQSINSQHELLVRRGLLRMTGVPYTASMLVHDEPAGTEGRPERKTKPLADM